MLGIINERIIFEGTIPQSTESISSSFTYSHFSNLLCHFLFAILAVSAGQPSLISDDADVVALVGTSKDLAKQINQKEVHWGVCYSSTAVMNLFVSCSIKTVDSSSTVFATFRTHLSHESSFLFFPSLSLCCP